MDQEVDSAQNAYIEAVKLERSARPIGVRLVWV
jgi:hypothetical protein